MASQEASPPDTGITLRYRLMLAGGGLWIGLIVGVFVWLFYFKAAKAEVVMYCVGRCMALFALIGLLAPKALGDTFLRFLKYAPLGNL